MGSLTNVFATVFDVELFKKFYQRLGFEKGGDLGNFRDVLETLKKSTISQESRLFVKTTEEPLAFFKKIHNNPSLGSEPAIKACSYKEFGKCNQTLCLIKCDGSAVKKNCGQSLHHMCQAEFMGDRDLYDDKCVAIPEKKLCFSCLSSDYNLWSKAERDERLKELGKINEKAGQEKDKGIKAGLGQSPENQDETRLNEKEK